MASHAHLSRLRVHGSGSSFRRGVYKVGHSADFRFREGNVSADDVGTGSRYGVGRSRSTGNVGGSKEMPRRRVAISSCFRMRFKWPRSGVSRPICFNHLQLETNECMTMVEGERADNALEHGGDMTLVWNIHNPCLC